jgi:hypothetical protein
MAESGQVFLNYIILNGGCSVKWTSTIRWLPVILDFSKNDGNLLLKKEDNALENDNVIFEVILLIDSVMGCSSLTLMDNPTLLVSTNSYLLDVSAGP